MTKPTKHADRHIKLTVPLVRKVFYFFSYGSYISFVIYWVYMSNKKGFSLWKGLFENGGPEHFAYVLPLVFSSALFFVVMTMHNVLTSFNNEER